jgi:hypothetical protein
MVETIIVILDEKRESMHYMLYVVKTVMPGSINCHCLLFQVTLDHAGSCMHTLLIHPFSYFTLYSHVFVATWALFKHRWALYQAVLLLLLLLSPKTL